MRFKLRFPHLEIEKWAAQYSYASDAAIEDVIAPAARRQGYLTRDQFLTIAEWKTARSRSRCRKNDAGYVKEVTGAALRSKNERFKIEVLRLLDGVDITAAEFYRRLPLATTHPTTSQPSPGRFAETYNALLKKGEQHPIEKTGAKLRAMMPWMKKHSIKGAQAAY